MHLGQLYALSLGRVILEDVGMINDFATATQHTKIPIVCLTAEVFDVLKYIKKKILN